MLLAILGLGLALAVSKALQNQQQTIAQGLGVVLLREAATQTANQIEVDPVDIGGQDLPVSDDSQPTTVTVTIGGVPIDLEYTPGSFSIQSTDIFSGDGTVRLDL